MSTKEVISPLHPGLRRRLALAVADLDCQDQSANSRTLAEQACVFPWAAQSDPLGTESMIIARRESFSAFGKGGYDDFECQVPAVNSRPPDLWR